MDNKIPLHWTTMSVSHFKEQLATICLKEIILAGAEM